ncbi:hypothetical protein AXF42_Ash009131 [Apostasia shenzhenica]|uniref:Uncharacterized protein n=1 Tax=Apostasia shenzhenica TaxID=1088818 RepID=A0A2I0ADQ2_9ASPA|nr:hypothetical protein AXF42_Ash009131 [Apostasia shenzhenica]
MWILPWRSRSCAASYFFVVFLIFALIPGSFADEFSIVSHPSRLSLASGRPVENSPGVRPGAVVTCNRVHIRGLARIHDLGKFFHALKLTVVVSPGDGLFRLQTVELCLHRNSSLGVGMCPAGDWRKLSKGSMVRSLSPFEHWFLDVRVLPDPSRFVEVTTELEFLSYRVVFMVLGFSMLVMSHSLSQSIAFYYGGAMTVGIILVTLLVLYQGMKLLPTGRKSSLAIVIYSSVVGIAASLLRHISGILRAALVEFGIYEDMHKPVCKFLYDSRVTLHRYHFIILVNVYFVVRNIIYFHSDLFYRHKKGSLHFMHVFKSLS